MSASRRGRYAASRSFLLAWAARRLRSRESVSKSGTRSRAVYVLTLRLLGSGNLDVCWLSGSGSPSRTETSDHPRHWHVIFRRAGGWELYEKTHIFKERKKEHYLLGKNSKKKKWKIPHLEGGGENCNFSTPKKNKKTSQKWWPFFPILDETRPTVQQCQAPR